MPGTRMSGGHARVGPAKKNAATTLSDHITDTTPPTGMTDAAELDYWHYYAPILVRRGLLTESSRDTLVNLCASYALRDRLSSDLSGMSTAFLVPVVDSNGKETHAIKANPLIAQLRAVRLECRQHANDLALSPAAAIRMPARKEAEQDDIDTWGGDARQRMKAVK